MSLQYEDPAEISKQEFVEILAEGVISMICLAIVRAAYHISDYQWVVDQYRVLLGSDDSDIKGVTLTSIGHLARLHPAANRAELEELVRPYLADLSVAGRAEDALEDIEVYLS